MAVITRYIVVRNGVELEKVFSDRKEAEAYDRMLEAGEQIAALIKEADLDPPVDAAVIDAIGVFLAENGSRVARILKGVKPVAALESPPVAAPENEPAPDRPPSPARTGKTRHKGV